MARHFLSLYLTIVLTLALATLVQDALWQRYGSDAGTDHAPQTAALTVIAQQLESTAFQDRAPAIAELAKNTDLDVELLDPQDVSGDGTLDRLSRGESVVLEAAGNRAWVLQKLPDEGRVLAFHFDAPSIYRSPLDWMLAFALYAAIALVIMFWLWPLTRDLRALERSTSRFGDRNWTFDANIKPESQVYPLAQSFRRMVTRIDGLISSHKDMSNALSHEIKTPLARMRFEIELARTARDSSALAKHLDNLNNDVTELNSFVSATLEYAVLERAEIALNLGQHDFSKIIPAICESVRRDRSNGPELICSVDPHATHVVCDAHLTESVIRNLLYNAVRYARSIVRVTFHRSSDAYQLIVEDDGPGIPDADRKRIFESFVQLNHPTHDKSGFGLGLAIVKRIIEWHGGSIEAQQSELGGAKFVSTWLAKV